MDGIDSLSNKNPGPGQYRNESARAGLQSEANDSDLWCETHRTHADYSVSNRSVLYEVLQLPEYKPLITLVVDLFLTLEELTG